MNWLRGNLPDNSGNGIIQTEGPEEWLSVWGDCQPLVQVPTWI